KSTKSMQNYRVVAMWNERALANPEQKAAFDAHLKRVDAKTAEIKSATTKARASLKREVWSRGADYLIAARAIARAGASVRSIMAEPGGDQSTGVLLREAESFERGNVGVDRDGHGAGIGVILNAGPMPNFAEYDFDVPEAGVFQVELRYAAAEPRPVR